MRILLDTHVLLWWFADSPLLSKDARNLISQASQSVVVSAASAWEIATKVRLGKLPTAAHLAAHFREYIDGQEFELLSISADHAIRAGSLPGHHKDPFDRMLIAQAQCENIPLVSKETLFDSYAMRRIW